MGLKKHAEVCPVCKCSGKYKNYIDCNHTALTYTESTCHGCGGSGWVTVTDDATPELPYQNPYGRVYINSDVEKCEYLGQTKVKLCDGYDHYISCHIPYID